MILSVKCGCGSLCLLLILGSAKAQVPVDKEAYVPRPGFEEEQVIAAEMPSEDIEAFIPRPGFEEPTAEAIDEEFLVKPESERPTRRILDKEKYVLRPGFEDDVTRPAEPPDKDAESFIQRPGFEDFTAKIPESIEPPRILEATGGGLSLMLNQKPLLARIVARGTPNFEKDGRIAIRVDETRIISFYPRLQDSVARKTLGLRDPIELTGHRMVRPIGVVEAISISRQGRLVYLSESVLDRSLLTTKLRHGLAIRQLEDQISEMVFSGPDRNVYEAPVRVSHGDKSIVLSAGETGELKADNATYGVNILFSRYAIPKESRYAFEGPKRQIDYVIWRK